MNGHNAAAILSLSWQIAKSKQDLQSRDHLTRLAAESRIAILKRALEDIAKLEKSFTL